MGVRGYDPGRIISRTGRCQNCIHFDIEEKAASHFRHCVERDRKVLAEKGCQPEGIREHIQNLERAVRDVFGAVGFCTIRDKRTDDGVAGDFTAFNYRCDKWNGRVIISPQDAALDSRAEEVLANLKKGR